MKQGHSQKELLGLATAKYAANIYQAEDYLASRGITREAARLARFGVVEEPEVGHEAFKGRLSIPYTITLSACVGIPCIGVPGANSWKKHYTRLLADFERVFVFADGDQPGKEFAASLARELPVTVVQMPDEEDVNSCYVKYGSQYIRERMGLNEI